MKNIFGHIGKVFRELLPAFLFFFVMFHMLSASRALMYNVIVKTIAFSIAAIIFFVIEEMFRLSIKTGSPSAAWERLAGDINWLAFWLRQVWLTLLISVYCAAVELIRLLGVNKVKNIFFGIVKK
ncbi:MAG: hypothetical protein NTZ95_02970 [Candidatus Omnitrophica bacterium]|nr:hypothetical protein [Candidatus Omnitrophota bacterium]